MRNFVLAGLAAASIFLSFTTTSIALPPVGFSAPPQDTAVSSVDEVRQFCYNRYTGVFKHWGPCHPSRVYCYNRYTGEFKHWGACYN